MVDGVEVKTVQEMESASIQSRARLSGTTQMSLLLWLASAGQLIAPWWSTRRDIDLRRFWVGSDYLSSSIYTIVAKLTAVPFRVEPRDPAVRTQRQQAEFYQQLLYEGSEFGMGWMELWSKALLDLYTQDNGMFIEVIGEGAKTGPIAGPVLGLAHLDAGYCTRTGSPEYPVLYQDGPSGNVYRLHRTRVLYGSQLPSPIADMLGVGFSAISRCINNAQHLIDISTYEQEKLGSRPKRQILITTGGLDPEAVDLAFRQANSEMDSGGLTRYSKAVLLGNADIPDAGLNIIDMASAPDGFDKETSVTLGMFAIALAFGVPPRWLWPATQIGATRADAMYQHVVGQRTGTGQVLGLIVSMLGGSEYGQMHSTGKVLPPQLKMQFDFQDDEQDRLQAEIREVRSRQRERDLLTGTLDIRTARQQAMEGGEITEAQFEDMELKDGRLPDGRPALCLFADPAYSDLLSGTPDQMRARCLTILGNPSSRSEVKRAGWALAAVDATTPKLEPVAEDEEQEAVVKSDPFGDDVLKRTYSEADFGLDVRAAARGLWNGAFDLFGFVDSLNSTVMRGYEVAWREGAMKCGVYPEERTTEEQQALDGHIMIAQQHIMGFAEFIQSNSKAEGKAWAVVASRAAIWSNRYGEVKAQAHQMSCANGKSKWVWNPMIEQHCSDCSRLNGRVYRNSIWQKYGIRPRSRELECGGWRCGCEFVVTDERCTPGRPPAP